MGINHLYLINVDFYIMKRKIILLFLLFFSHVAIGQYKIIGTVVDINSQKISDCAIYLLDRDSSVISTTISDERGSFSFSTDDALRSLCFSSLITYDTCIQLKLKPGENKFSIVLKPYVNVLDEVVVEANRAVESRGDSIFYNKKYFERPLDNSIGDVMKRIPGITFKNGQLYFMGQQINNIIVGGQDIFSGDAAALNEAIHKDNIKDIVIIKQKDENNNEVLSLSLPMEEKAKSRINGNFICKTNSSRWSGDAQPYIINDKAGIRCQLKYRKDDENMLDWGKTYNKWDNLLALTGNATNAGYTFVNQSDMRQVDQNNDISAEVNYSTILKRLKVNVDVYFSDFNKESVRSNEVLSLTQNSIMRYSGLSTVNTQQYLGHLGLEYKDDEKYKISFDMPLRYVKYGFYKDFQSQSALFGNNGQKHDMTGLFSFIRIFKPSSYYQFSMDYKTKEDQRRLFQFISIDGRFDSLYQNDLYRNTSYNINNRYNFSIKNIRLTFNAGFSYKYEYLNNSNGAVGEQSNLTVNEVPFSVVIDYTKNKFSGDIKFKYPIYVERLYGKNMQNEEFWDMEGALRYKYGKRSYAAMQIRRVTYLPVLFQWDSTLVWNDFLSGYRGFVPLDRVRRSYGGNAIWNQELPGSMVLYAMYDYNRATNNIVNRYFLANNTTYIFIQNDSLTTSHGFNANFSIYNKKGILDNISIELYSSWYNSLSYSSIRSRSATYTGRMRLNLKLLRELEIENSLSVNSSRLDYDFVPHTTTEFSYSISPKSKWRDFSFNLTNKFSFNNVDKQYKFQNILDAAIQYSLKNKHFSFFIEGHNILRLKSHPYQFTTVTDGSINTVYFQTIPGYVLFGVRFFR